MDLLPLSIILVLHCLSECDSQKVNVDSLKTVTGCRVGLRAGEDSLIFTGTANASGVDFNVWETQIQFVIRKDGVALSNCSVSIGACIRAPRAGCYCVATSETIYKMVLDITASEELSNASVTLIWPSVDGKHMIDSNIWRVPPIYDVLKVKNTLEINFENVSMIHEMCKFTIRDPHLYIQHCCSLSMLPCVSKITSHGKTITGSPCAVSNFVTSLEGAYVFSRSVCGKDSPTVVTCHGVKGTVSTPAPAYKASPHFNGYRNAAIFMASTIAIGLIVATVHRLDASLLFKKGAHIPRIRMDSGDSVQKC